MLSIDQIFLFSATAVVLAFTPGPDIIYVLTRGASQGRAAGFAATAGFSLGCLVHTFFVIVGLSAVLASSAVAFTVVKIAGAAYLVWIGIKLFRAPAMLTGGPAEGGESGKFMPDKALWTIFRQSVVANVLNPKVAIFFLALFPQFLEPERGGVIGQTIGLGFLMVFWTLACFGSAAWFAGCVNSWLAARPVFGSRINKVAGGILAALGLKLAFSDM